MLENVKKLQVSKNVSVFSGKGQMLFTFSEIVCKFKKVQHLEKICAFCKKYSQVWKHIVLSKTIIN